MSKSLNQPRLLTTVMEAIANLKDTKGSTQKKIIDQVQCLLSSNNMLCRNPMIHIKKALRHGVNTGLIKQKGGKFKLGLDSKDYAIFKNFQKMSAKKELPIRELKRRRKRRKRSRRKRRRSRSSPDDYASVSGSATESFTGTPEPTDRGRRRGRKKRRKRRRRMRRRSEEADWSNGGHANSVPKYLSRSNSKDGQTTLRDRDRDRDRTRDRDIDRDRGRSRERDRDRDRDHDRDRDRDRDRNRDMNDEEHCDGITCQEDANNNVDDPTCDNPDCLCNIKQE